MRTLPIGAPIPEFDLSDQNGRRHRPQDHRGHWLVLYFYVADHTPVCTVETRTFETLRERFEALGALVLGISSQGPDSHRAFADACGARFPLLADPNRDLQGRFGVKSVYGLAKRVTFLVDPQGCVADAYRNEFRGSAHAEWALRRLGELRRAPATP